MKRRHESARLRRHRNGFDALGKGGVGGGAKGIGLTISLAPDARVSGAQTKIDKREQSKIDIATQYFVCCLSFASSYPSCYLDIRVPVKFFFLTASNNEKFDRIKWNLSFSACIARSVRLDSRCWIRKDKRIQVASNLLVCVSDVNFERSLSMMIRFLPLANMGLCGRKDDIKHSFVLKVTCDRWEKSDGIFQTRLSRR